MLNCWSSNQDVFCLVGDLDTNLRLSRGDRDILLLDASESSASCAVLLDL